MRIFATGAIKNMMGRFNIAEDEPIENKLITNALEKAQEKIEGFNFDARKHVLEFDDVLNYQRSIIYKTRKTILTGGRGEVEAYLNEAAPLLEDDLRDRFLKKVAELMEKPESLETLRRVILQTHDQFWVDHLETMDYLRSSVNLRAYGQRDPLVEYKKEGLRYFKDLEASIARQIAEFLVALDPGVTFHTPQTSIEKSATSVADVRVAPVVPEEKNLGRNDPCWCGSGKKFKKCHGVS
jgi:preprotein translocase subunit SecA